MKKKIVVIDPGHGGRDSGAKGSFLEEKDVTLHMSNSIRESLARRGVKVLLTRDPSEDRSTPLKHRVNVANRSGADAFVSVHMNGFHRPSARGTEVFHFPASKEGHRLGYHVYNRMKEAVPNCVARGLKAKSLYVLRNTAMWAILVEPAFLTNPQEEQTFKRTHVIVSVAEAIADGVLAFLSEGDD